MLGLAFSEAKRSENLGLRLQQRSAAAQKEQQSPNAGVGSPNPSSSGHKRTRRRRRPKKSRGGGGDPNALAARQGAQGIGGNGLAAAAAPSFGSSSATNKKQHDAPMTKRDLYFCLRSSVVVAETQGYDNVVGRVTLVNWENQVVLDRFVKVPLLVADYRTEVTGITKENLSSPEAITFDHARTEVGRLIKGKILIGHGLEVDLSALGLSHPWCDVRDTATYVPYMEEVQDPNRASASMMLPRDLPTLVHAKLDRDVAGCPIQEAIACLELYKVSRAEWETELINLAQQKNRQRELVLSMRSGHRDPHRKGSMSVPLSAIREGEMAAALGTPDSVNQPPVLIATPIKCGQLGHQLFEESTLVSTEPTTQRNSLTCVEDDGSQASSLDVASSISSISRFNPGGLSEIVNLELLNEPSAPGEGYWPPSTASDISIRSPISDTRIWQPPSPSGPSWSQNGGSSSPQVGDSRISAAQQVPVDTDVTEEDEELLKHLPSQLLADLDAEVENGARDNAVTSLHTQPDLAYHQGDPHEKKQWFRSLRKTKTQFVRDGRASPARSFNNNSVARSLGSDDAALSHSSGAIVGQGFRNSADPWLANSNGEARSPAKDTGVLSLFRRLSLSGNEVGELG